MLHLTGKNCAAAEHLFPNVTDVSLHACMQGYMGEVWCDDGMCRCGQIILGDFCFFDGDASHPQARELVAHLPENKPFDEWYLVGSNEAWNQLIESFWGERAEAFTRYSFHKEGTVFDREKLQRFAETLPKGYTICQINGEIYHQLMKNPWSWDACIQFESEEDFLKRGLGFVVLFNGEVVAQASSYSIYNNGLDITISTHKDHRRKGLAKACVSTLILAALERDWYPNWDARTLISVSLAEQLGYKVERPYKTYCVKVK